MSTPNQCSTGEVALCQPDRTIIVNTNHKKTSEPECAAITEKQFMRDHTIYSAISSWLFAISGATNIGVLGVLSSKAMTAAEQGRPLFKSNDPSIQPVLNNKKYNIISIGMLAFGGVCMAISNLLESKKVVTEWQLGAGKLQRKAEIAEKEVKRIEADVQPAAPIINSAPVAAQRPEKKWANIVHTKASDSIEASANPSRIA